MPILGIFVLFLSSMSFAAKGGSSSSAGGTGATLRLIGGASGIKPADVNESFEAQHLQKASASLLLGGELGYAFSPVEVGIRYLNNQVSRSEEPANPLSTYSGSISQDLIAAMVHVPLIKKEIFHFDLFGGYGIAGTRLKVKTATQRGEINNKAFSSPISMGGAAIALGSKNFFISIEGGYLNNKATNFTRTGTISSEIETVDMSGTYAAISVLIYGGGFADILKPFAGK